MSELKTRFIDDTYAEYFNTGKHELAQIYIKSEADKVIARHKYRRCLAMAMWCRSRACFYDTMRASSFWARKSDRAYKWHKRWLELAERLKEAK